jgi:Ca2+-binding RTX toxin-like protein
MIADRGPGGRPEGGRTTEVLGAQVAQAPAVDAACDIDGVGVNYDVSFTPAAPAGYKAVAANVTGVSQTCVGATVTVRLKNGSTVIATGVVPASGTTVPVPFSSPPPAQSVTGVEVEIAGGTVPIPAECNGITFDTFGVLTNGNDSHTAGNRNDLRYGLDGNDTIFGANQRDCLVGQNGNDTLRGENHDDVLLGGPGTDTLEGGNQNDVLDGGDANDVLDGGNQNDTLRGGAGNDTIRGGNGTDTCVGGPGTDTFTGCEATTQ